MTGGAGFIGSAVIRRALATGHEVINLDKLTYAACLDNLRTVAGHARYHFEHGDICNAAHLKRIFDTYQPEAVMHLAAESHVDRSIDGPADFVQTNINGTFHLVEAARQFWMSRGAPRSFRFLHVSTDEVFGTLGATGYFSETSAYAPNSPYAASKASSDHLIRAYGETYDLPVIITNCSNNFGPYQFPEKLIPLAIQRALAAQPVPIYGKGAEVRDWLFVDDHAAALLGVLAKGRVGEVYAIGGNAEHTNIDLVTKLCSILDQMRPKKEPYAKLVQFVENRPGHDARYAIDARKIKSELGWTPSHSFDARLRETVRWYLNNQVWVKNLSTRAGVGKRLGLSRQQAGIAA